MQKLSIRILNIQTYPARYIVTFAAQEITGKFCYELRESDNISALVGCFFYIFIFIQLCTALFFKPFY